MTDIITLLRDIERFFDSEGNLTQPERDYQHDQLRDRIAEVIAEENNRQVSGKSVNVTQVTETGDTRSPDDEDICGFCGLPGADKFPHPVRWPGEQSAGTELVHEQCESAECARAHAALSDKQREQFLYGLR